MHIEFAVVQGKTMKVKSFEEAPIGIKLATAGTSACLADLVTFPLDTAKVRLQVQGEGRFEVTRALRYKGIINTISTIIREEGTKSLYRGLSAGLQRQMCFASVRIGMYENVKDFYSERLIGENKMSTSLDILVRTSAGITTGALAVILAQPTDIVKVRFQAQHGGNKRYKSTLEAYKTIFNQEGLRGLWKGMYPNIARNAVVNVSEIVCYDLVKSAILKEKLLQDNTLCHFTSAVITGFITTVVSSPVDVIKTRYMNSPSGQYKSAVDCAWKTIQLEGLAAFYKGFTPSFYRLLSWNIVMWVSYEKLKILVIQMFHH